MATIEQGDGSQISEEVVKAQFGKYLGTRGGKDAGGKEEISLEELLSIFENDEPRPHNAPMSEITREELRQSLDAFEDRMDQRMARIEQSANERAAEFRREIALREESIRRELELRQQAFRDEQSVRDKALDERFDGFFRTQAERDIALNQRFQTIDGRLTEISSEMKNVEGATRTWGMWVVGTVIASAFGVWLGISQFNSSVVSNALSGFGYGKDAGTSMAELKQEVKELKAQKEAPEPEVRNPAPDQKPPSTNSAPEAPPPNRSTGKQNSH